MGYTLVNAPSAEPITRDEAKLHLRVTSAAEDTLIDALITAARQYAEQKTQRSLVTQTWRRTLDRFPGGCSNTPWGREFSIPDDAIQLLKGPVQSITSITYLDMAGATQTMSADDYTVDLSGPVARITPVFGVTWPPTLPQIGAVKVTFPAGYGDPDDVPAGIKQWMLLRIGALYANREEVGRDLKPLPFIDSLLDPYCILVA